MSRIQYDALSVRNSDMIILCRDESARFRVWNNCFWFYLLDFFFSNEMLTIFGWSHVRLHMFGKFMIFMKRNGQLVKLNTFLITFNFPNILSSIRMDLYNVKVSPYVAIKRFALFDLLKNLYSDTNILSKYIPSLQKKL
jgi:hypothetical protein